MPRKGKRSKNSIADLSSSKRKKHVEISEQSRYKLENKSDAEVICARCIELGIPVVVSALKSEREEIHGFSTSIVQRLFFDTSFPPVPSCGACTSLDRELGSWHGLSASRIIQEGVSVNESEKLRSES
jgi:hypothetical protein